MSSGSPGPHGWNVKSPISVRVENREVSFTDSQTTVVTQTASGPVTALIDAVTGLVTQVIQG